ncbi:MAG: NAD-dependent epimerase/dehydratase family protein [Bacteroidales bacterium]|nr:NAD-dependent epimerase/dehydratase family protein [Bacteroidales bacterium]
MKIILTGATGFVGEGVLLECLNDIRVDKVLSISRRPCGHQHPKLEEYLVGDMMVLSENDERLQGYDALFFCAGISSVGMSEEEYRPISYDIPMHLAKILSQKEKTTYIFVSGAGTGSSAQMWGKVKRQTENELQQLGFKQVFNFRPALMKPLKGQLHIKKMDKFLGWMFPLAKLIGGGNTLSQVGQAMLNATEKGYKRPTIKVKDINILTR